MYIDYFELEVYLEFVSESGVSKSQVWKWIVKENYLLING